MAFKYPPGWEEQTALSWKHEIMRGPDDPPRPPHECPHRSYHHATDCPLMLAARAADRDMLAERHADPEQLTRARERYDRVFADNLARIRAEHANDVIPDAPKKKRSTASAKLAEATAEIARLRAECEQLRAASVAHRLDPDPEPIPELPASLAVVPWTREDGKEYRTIRREGRKGHTKALAVPVEYCEAVARALTA